MECIREISNKSSNESSIWQRQPYYFSYGGHILLCMAYLLLIITTLLTNGMLLLTIPLVPSLRSSMNTLLMNVCLAHIFSSLALLPFVFVVDVSKITSTHQGAVCSVTEGLSLFFICCGVSQLNLAAISFNRFLAIKYPTKQTWRLSRRSAYLFNIVAWLLSTSLVIPTMLSYKYYTEIGICLRHWGNINAPVYRICLLMLGNIGPVSFSLMSFIALRVTLKNIAVRDGLNASDMRDVRMAKAQRTVGRLLLSFFISWTPFCTYWGIYNIANYFSSCDGEIQAIKWLRMTVLFASLNGAIDPFIYASSSSDLNRETYLRLSSLYRLFCSRPSSNRVHPLASQPGLSISLQRTYSQPVVPFGSN